MDNNERKLRILKVIIDDFINTAQPIGSRTIAKKYGLGISSATIRNEMADLEDLGYLIQPHTSAGRIPSDEGYRVYVDSLMNQKRIARNDREIIRTLLLTKVIEIDDVIKQSVKLLSDMTKLISFASLPQFNKSKLTNMKLVKINNSKIMLILVADSGIVKTLNLQLNIENQQILDDISEVFMSLLNNSTIEDISVKKISMIKNLLPQYEGIINYLVPILRDTLNELDGIDTYVEGINNVFDFPEFSDVNSLKEFVEIIQDKDVLFSTIIGREYKEGITIRIGKEIENDNLENCSVINVCYKVNGKYVGKIGVIGPTRMDYGKVISVLDYVRETLSDIFTGIFL